MMKDRKNKNKKQTKSISDKPAIKSYPIHPPLVSILKPSPLIYNGKEIKAEGILLETVVFPYDFNIMT